MSRKIAADAVHLRRRFSMMYARTCRRRASHSAHSLCSDWGAESTESILSGQPVIKHSLRAGQERELFFGLIGVSARSIGFGLARELLGLNVAQVSSPQPHEYQGGDNQRRYKAR